MNIRELSDRLGLDEEDFVVLLEMLITTAKADLDNLSGSVKDGNMEDAANYAHSLKGSAGNLGFMDFSSLAAEIEKAKQADHKALETKIEDLYAEYDLIKKLLKGS